jgi:hypothetical protein
VAQQNVTRQRHLKMLSSQKRGGQEGYHSLMFLGTLKGLLLCFNLKIPVTAFRACSDLANIRASYWLVHLTTASKFQVILLLLLRASEFFVAHSTSKRVPPFSGPKRYNRFFSNLKHHRSPLSVSKNINNCVRRQGLSIDTPPLRGGHLRTLTNDRHQRIRIEPFEKI